MEVIRFFIELLPDPLRWLFFSWLIWLALRWRNWSRPTVPMMLIYSTSVEIFYIKSQQALRACIELCFPIFSVFPFIAAVSFWFIVLYIPVALTLKPKGIFAQVRKYWWIAFPIIALAAWHISVGLAGIIRFRQDLDLIASDIFSDIFFYPVMIILLAWLFWLLLPIFQWPAPTFLTMFTFSIAVANAATRLWMYDYHAIFSLPLFLLEVTIWFIILYVLTKLTLILEMQVPV